MARSTERLARVNFWRANHAKEIRIGSWDKCGNFRTVATVPVKGREYSDAEAAKAEALCNSINANSHSNQGERNG